MATAVAALKAKATRRIFDHFVSVDAVSPERAVSFTPNYLILERQFERMERAGVIRSTSENHYWIDLAEYRSWQAKRRWRIAAAGFVGLIAAVALLG